jgi:hypothetical protein
LTTFTCRRGKKQILRQLKERKAALVLVAVDKRDRLTGRTRMAVMPEFKNVMPGSTV